MQPFRECQREWETSEIGHLHLHSIVAAYRIRLFYHTETDICCNQSQPFCSENLTLHHAFNWSIIKIDICNCSKQSSIMTWLVFRNSCCAVNSSCQTDHPHPVSSSCNLLYLPFSTDTRISCTSTASDRLFTLKTKHILIHYYILLYSKIFLFPSSVNSIQLGFL